MRKVETEAVGNNERTIIPGRAREKHEIREKRGRRRQSEPVKYSLFASGSCRPE